MSLYNHSANWTVSIKKRPSISDFCSPLLVTVELEAEINDMLTIMEEASIRHLPVVENGQPIGIVSERDLRVFQDRDFADKYCARDIMTEKPYTVKESEDLLDVVNNMIEDRLGSCLIVDEFMKVIGIFTMIDALKILKKILKE